MTGGYGNIKAKVDSEYGHFTVGGNNYQEVDMRTHSQVGFVKNATGSPAKVKFDLSVTQSLYGVIDFNNLIGSYSVVDCSPIQGAIDGDNSNFIRTSGPIDKIGELLPNLTNFNMTYISTVTGNIKSFAGCLNISSIILSNSTGINGSLEELANSQVTLGRTSGTLVVTCNGVITYNGSAITNNTQKTITYSDSGYVIS